MSRSIASRKADETAALTNGKSNLWSDLLVNVSNGIASEAITGHVVGPEKGDGIQDSSDPIGEKHILVLGGENCGKATFVNMLRGTGAKHLHKNVAKTGYALDYYYIDIKDEENDFDDSRSCSVWVLRTNNNNSCTSAGGGVSALLQSSYNANLLQNTLFAIVLDFSQPWGLKQGLESGIANIKSIISQLEISDETLEGFRKRLERRFQLYFDNETSAKAANVTEELLPLGDGVLVENLGVPIMVICTKLDLISELEKNYKYNDEHFDYIQQFLRNECLKHGGSLAYASSKDSRYSSSLYKLILHSLYNVLPKSGSLPSVVEKDSILVPIGWDSLLKIKTIQDNLIGEINLDLPFDEVCKYHPTNKRQSNEVSGTPLMAEEEQQYVNRNQSLLQKPVQTPGFGFASPKPASGNRTPLSSTTHAKDNEANLTQFFNSLLSNNKGRATPGSAAAALTPLKGASDNAVARKLSSQPGGTATPTKNSAPTQS